MSDAQRAGARDIVRRGLAQSADADLEIIAELLDDPDEELGVIDEVERDDQLRIWGARLSRVSAEAPQHERLAGYVDALRRLRPDQLATSIGILARRIAAHVLVDGRGNVVATMVMSLGPSAKGSDP